jgi:anti-sigma-K factor RskA
MVKNLGVNGLKGWRTFLANSSVVAVAVLTIAVGVDWTEYVSPTKAIIITAVANMVLRLITNSPPGKSE